MKFTLALTCILAVLGAVDAKGGKKKPLKGKHYRITLVRSDGFVNFDSKKKYSGYIPDMIANVAKMAGFTYELVRPSGRGPSCSPRATRKKESYADVYNAQYLCAQEDVIDDSVPNKYASDMYWSMFFITPARQLANRFTLPFKPPSAGLTMYGTATGFTTIEELIELQASGDQMPACIAENTAYGLWLKEAFPDLQTYNSGSAEEARSALEDGHCEVIINAEPNAFVFVKNAYDTDSCEANGKPIGIIGSLSYGLTQFGVGVGKHIDQDEVDWISYYLNLLMTCAPTNDDCDGSLYEGYTAVAGTGAECGYGQE